MPDVVESQIVKKEISPLPFPVNAEIIYTEQSHHFDFEIENLIFQINNNGNARLNSTILFELDLFGGDYIEYVSYFKYYKDVLLVYQSASEEAEGGALVLVDPVDGSFKWLKKIPGFNLGAGPVEDHYIYITSVGFVGKLDLNQGDFVWKLEGLSRNDDSFISVKPLQIRDDIVILREDDAMKSHVKVLLLNKYTGALVEGGN